MAPQETLQFNQPPSPDSVAQLTMQPWRVHPSMCSSLPASSFTSRSTLDCCHWQKSGCRVVSTSLYSPTWGLGKPASLCCTLTFTFRTCNLGKKKKKKAPQSLTGYLLLLQVQGGERRAITRAESAGDSQISVGWVKTWQLLR